jgi:hypothetical protein
MPSGALPRVVSLPFGLACPSYSFLFHYGHSGSFRIVCTEPDPARRVDSPLRGRMLDYYSGMRASRMRTLVQPSNESASSIPNCRHPCGIAGKRRRAGRIRRA